MKRTLARLLLGGGLALAASGHGDLHERIARLDERLRDEPGRARLWLERGELHRQHRDWTAAERDLSEAARLEPNLPGLELARARLWAEQGRTDDALAALERLVAQPTAMLETRRLRAQLLLSAGRASEAATAWAEVTGSPGRPQPSDYLELAAALDRSGRPAEGIRALADGLGRLGPLPALEVRLVEALAAAGRFDEALARIETARRRAQRPEAWLARQAEVLQAAGRPAEAAAAAREGLAAIERLPAVRRDTEAVREIALKLRRLLSP